MERLRARFRVEALNAFNTLRFGSSKTTRVVFVVDWVISRRERSKWKYAYPIVSERIATAYTDIMRLLYVASTRDGGYVDGLGRYPGFHERLCGNLDHLRSTIEGFVIALDSPSH